MKPEDMIKFLDQEIEDEKDNHENITADDDDEDVALIMARYKAFISIREFIRTHQRDGEEYDEGSQIPMEERHD